MIQQTRDGFIITKKAMGVLIVPPPSSRGSKLFRGKAVTVLDSEWGQNVTQHAICKKGDVEAINSFLPSKLNPLKQQHPGLYEVLGKLNAVHAGAVAADVPLMAAVLRRGAAVDCRTAGGYTPLSAIFLLLLTHHAKGLLPMPSQTAAGSSHRTDTDFSWTLPSKQRLVAAAEYLLGLGADPNVSLPLSKGSGLYAAGQAGSADLLQEPSLLHVAAYLQDQSLCTLLLTHGASTTATDAAGRTPAQLLQALVAASSQPAGTIRLQAGAAVRRPKRKCPCASGKELKECHWIDGSKQGVECAVDSWCPCKSGRLYGECCRAAGVTYLETLKPDEDSKEGQEQVLVDIVADMRESFKWDGQPTKGPEWEAAVRRAKLYHVTHGNQYIMSSGKKSRRTTASASSSAAAAAPSSASSTSTAAAARAAARATESMEDVWAQASNDDDDDGMDMLDRQRLANVRAALNHPSAKGRVDPAFEYALKHPKVDWLHRGIYKKHGGMAVDYNGAVGRMRDWNAAVDEYIASGRDSRSKDEIEKAAKIGMHGGALHQPVKPGTPDVCGHCSKHGAAAFCSVCRGIKYCNGACQKAHWKAHKRSCIEAPPVTELPSQIAFNVGLAKAVDPVMAEMAQKLNSKLTSMLAMHQGLAAAAAAQTGVTNSAAADKLAVDNAMLQQLQTMVSKQCDHLGAIAQGKPLGRP